MCRSLRVFVREFVESESFTEFPFSGVCRACVSPAINRISFFDFGVCTSSAIKSMFFFNFGACTSFVINGRSFFDFDACVSCIMSGPSFPIFGMMASRMPRVSVILTVL